MARTVISKRKTTYALSRGTAPIDKFVGKALEEEGIVKAKSGSKIDYLIITHTYSPTGVSLVRVKKRIGKTIKRLKNNGKVMVIIPGDVDNGHKIDGLSYADWIANLIKHVTSYTVRDVRYCVLKDVIAHDSLSNPVHPLEQLLRHQTYAPPEPYHKRSPVRLSDLQQKITECLFRVSYANKVIIIGTNRNIKTGDLQTLARECGIPNVDSTLKTAKDWQSVFASADYYLTVTSGVTLRQLLVEIADEIAIGSDHPEAAISTVIVRNENKIAKPKSTKNAYVGKLIGGVCIGLIAATLVAPLVSIATVSASRVSHTRKMRENVHQVLGWAHRQNSKQLSLLQQFSSPLGLSVNSLEQLENRSYYQTKAWLHMQTALELATKGLSQILTLRAPDPRPTLREAQTNMQQARVYQDQATIFGTDSLSRPDIETAERLISFVVSLIDMHPDANIALLIQDDSELRATGGFLDAVALIDLKNRHVANLDIQSSSELDRKLLGQVVPPPSLTRFLKEENWLLRDANWDTDFQKVGPEVSRFLKEQTGIDHQVIIAITTSELDVLVGDEDRSIAAQLRDINQEHGSGADKERKDVYVQRINKLLSIGKEGGKESIQRLAGLLNTVERKNAMIYTSYEDLRDTVAEASWGGGVIVPQCQILSQENTCVADMLYVTESNIGVNKVNDAVKRRHEHLVEIHEESAGVTHVFEIQNQDQRDGWPGGEYKVLVRWHVPKQSKGITLAVGETVLEYEQYEMSIDGAHRLLEYASIVPAKTSQRITLQYELPIEANVELERYTYVHQKQPGVKDAPLIVAIKQSGTGDEGGEVFEQKQLVLDRDQLVSVEFAN